MCIIFVLKMTTTEVKDSTFKPLRETFLFLGHLSIAMKCYLATRPGLPVLRLILSCSNIKFIVRTQITFICGGAGTSFLKYQREILHQNTERCGSSFPLKPVSVC